MHISVVGVDSLTRSLLYFSSQRFESAKILSQKKAAYKTEALTYMKNPAVCPDKAVCLYSCSSTSGAGKTNFSYHKGPWQAI